ncbi:hypothetical protein IWW42_003446 [Coemansia sp. RSA 1085]|nr:hypothetical protein IWW42_003446 [Coemansia sp. RSA 1085]
MSTEEFTIPIDSEFVLYQGWVTRNTRRRRKSDASVPSTISLPVPQIPLPPIPEHVSESSVAEQANGSVTCLVLDNKKICFARPRLVQIGSPSSL